MPPTRKRRPSVAGRRATQPELPDETTETEGAEVSDEPARLRLDRRFVAVALVVLVALAATAAAVWLGWRLVDARAALANDALSDRIGTDQVSEETADAVEAAFSYDYRKPEDHRQAAEKHLLDRAREHLDELYSAAIAEADRDKLQLRTVVPGAAVMSYGGDTARLLVVVDQEVVGAKPDQARGGGGAFVVTARKTADAWRIEDFTTN